MERLPFRSNLADYGRQADAVLNGWKAGDESAIRFFWEQHPRFRRPDVLWLPKEMEKVDIQKEVMTDEDARLFVARWYDFRDWAALRDWVEAVTLDGSPVSLFVPRNDSIRKLKRYSLH